jgi:hypothetical protein
LSRTAALSLYIDMATMHLPSEYPIPYCPLQDVSNSMARSKSVAPPPRPYYLLQDVSNSIAAGHWIHLFLPICLGYAGATCEATDVPRYIPYLNSTSSSSSLHRGTLPRGTVPLWHLFRSIVLPP